jgi:putative FMN-dependent luciferase-like monooxygenase
MSGTRFAARDQYDAAMLGKREKSSAHRHLRSRYVSSPPPAQHEVEWVTTAKPPTRLGFFTRLLDRADAAERYRLAIAQIVHAERCGFDSAWVAQHHFHEDEGGLPAPFVFLAQVAAQTARIRLGTGIVTLPLELPIRVAEDAAVLDLMCGGRLEVGVGPGGNLSAYSAFGLDSAARTALLVRHHRTLIDAWAGRELPGGDRLYPSNPGLVDRVWQATFTVGGARRAGAAGDGLMLSRTQPRPADMPRLSLPDIQNPMIDAYLEALPPGRLPRILASRTVFAADDRKEAMQLAEIGLARYAAIGRAGFVEGMSVHDQIAAVDIHTGTPDELIASLQADSALARATDLTVQVHSIDPPHHLILRSIELVAMVVAPALGWVRGDAAAARQVT